MRPLPTALLIAVVGTILALTLWPSPESAERLPLACVFCSERATADAIANVILFMPLGVALVWSLPRWRAPWRAGLGLSLAIELTQHFIVGRDPSVGDVITNTLGTQLGWLIVRHIGREMTRASRPIVVFGATLAFVAAIALTVWLLGPAPTRATYYGQWTPALGHLVWYRGRVLDARIGRLAVRPGPLSDVDPARKLVLGHGRLESRVIAGPRVAALAPIVSVYDDSQRELLLLGADREALVLRYRHRSAAWRLDEPDVRLEGAFAAVAAGDTIDIIVERTERAACFSLSPRAGCVAVATPGRAWSLVYYPESFPTWLHRLVDGLWLAGLALPLGWYAGWRPPLLAAGAVGIGALVALPALGAIDHSPPGELVAAAAGLLAGAVLRRLTAR